MRYILILADILNLDLYCYDNIWVCNFQLISVSCPICNIVFNGKEYLEVLLNNQLDIKIV